MKGYQHLEPRTVALLLAASIGLGIAVHEVFFLGTLGIIVIIATNAAHEHWKITHAQ